MPLPDLARVAVHFEREDVTRWLVRWTTSGWEYAEQRSEGTVWPRAEAARLVSELQRGRAWAREFARMDYVEGEQ